MHCVSRTRRRTCWLILSLAGWRWTAPSPSSPHLASRKKQGALGTADSGWETHCASFASLSCLLLSGHLVLSIWMRHCHGSTASFLSLLTPKGLIPHRFVGHFDLLNFHWSSVNPSPLDRLSRR